MTKALKGILLDSGMVLNFPKTGHWFITPNFYTYVNQTQFEAIRKKQKKRAFSAAHAYINQQKTIKTLADELHHFIQYFTIFFSHLTQLELEKGAVEAIAKDLVYNTDKYTFYDEVRPFLEQAKLNYQLAVVSDAWPSLSDVFQSANMKQYFQSFIISSQEGICKPDRRMYEKALEELNLKPEEVIFVDDRLKNCDGAAKLGIPAVLLCRDWPTYIYYKLTCRRQRVIRSLSDMTK